LFNEEAPALAQPKLVDGHQIDEMQLYYKGICRDCAKNKC
jgi:Fur family peroxide stress response transcriptional regulator